MQLLLLPPGATIAADRQLRALLLAPALLPVPHLGGAAAPVGLTLCVFGWLRGIENESHPQG